MIEVFHTATNVNSKPLYESIISELNDTTLSPTFFDWTNEIHRISAVELTSEILENFIDDNNRIVRYDVVSDSRNNDRLKNLIEREYIMDISYRQYNCLNDTKIHVVIKCK